MSEQGRVWVMFLDALRPQPIADPVALKAAFTFAWHHAIRSAPVQGLEAACQRAAAILEPAVEPMTFERDATLGSLYQALAAFRAAREQP